MEQTQVSTKQKLRLIMSTIKHAMHRQKSARTLHLLFPPFAGVSDAWVSQLKGVSDRAFIDLVTEILLGSSDPWASY